MQHVLLAFYILFFATGFMGGAALFVLGLRVHSRLIRPLLVFQILFLVGLGLVMLYFYLHAHWGVLIARGLANKEIASELGISPATVRTHIYNLYQKAGARSRVELINKLRD